MTDRLHIEAGLFVLRHGKAGHNQDGVIAAQSRNLAFADLIPSGIKQLELLAARSPFNGYPVEVVSSPARRCISSAELFIAKAGLVVPRGIQVRTEAGERDFGSYLEGGPKSGYRRVYKGDTTPDCRPYGSESTLHVAERFGNLVADFSDTSKYRPVVIFTHADPAEIWQAVTLGYLPNTHRLHVPKLRNGELRELAEV